MNTRKKKQITQPDMNDVKQKICRLVSQYPCLYDRSDANYLKTNFVKNVWEEIGAKMNMQAKTCQQRWAIMRGTYMRSIRLHPDGSTYYLANELQFLRKFIKPAPPDQKPKVEAKPKVRHAQSPNPNEPEYVDISSEEESENVMARKKLRLSKRGKEDVRVGAYCTAERVWDFDEAFLQGLRPEIGQMNFTQKLFFKRRMYDLLGEIFATPSGSGGSSEVVNANEIVSEPSISTQMKPIGPQLPKLIPKPQPNKQVTFAN